MKNILVIVQPGMYDISYAFIKDTAAISDQEVADTIDIAVSNNGMYITKKYGNVTDEYIEIYTSCVDHFIEAMGGHDIDFPLTVEHIIHIAEISDLQTDTDPEFTYFNDNNT
jgi:hypothetical protein